MHSTQLTAVVVVSPEEITAALMAIEAVVVDAIKADLVPDSAQTLPLAAIQQVVWEG